MGLNTLHPRLLPLLRQLDHTEFRSGEAIAARLGISRASVHGLVRQAEAFGVAVQAVHGRGYRLAAPIDLLDEARLASALAPIGLHCLCLGEVDSSNARLLHLSEAGALHGTLLAAEWQSQGRGRRGRTWQGVLGASLTFSLLWRFTRPVGALSGLSLAVGVAMLRALARLGLQGVALKWPNDLLLDGRKVAGILIELSGDMLGPAAAVIGIGLNVRAGARIAALAGTPAADLESGCGRRLERNRVLAALAEELGPALETFDRQGFAAFREAWQAAHCWQDRAVEVLGVDGTRIAGLARGVDEQGALLMETGAGQQRILSGEVSLRRAGE